VSKTPNLPFKIWYPVLIVISLALVGVGIWMSMQDPARQLRSLGAALLAVGAISTLAALVVLPIIGAINDHSAQMSSHQHKLFTSLDERLQQLSVMLNEISEQQLISDHAKAVAYRDKDRDALRRAIREEMLRKDWEAARALVDEMAKQFGYRLEAAGFHREIDEQEQEIVRRRIDEVVTVVDRYCRAEQWDAARLESQKLASEFPGNDQVRRVEEEIEARRQNFKRQLTSRWNLAVAQHDVDGGIDVLKQLDGYLTRDEAAAMQETARSVFKEKLQTLRLSFASFVQEHNWPEALRLGDQIIAEFPNSRAAQEVADKISALRQRAQAAEAAASA